jgi:tRNA pseudouridine65 synthase
VVVHRGRDTLRDYAALQRVRDLVGHRVWPVHRLDRQASGCLLFATERELAGPLHKALTGGEALKLYLAGVRGWFPHEQPTRVETPMKDDSGNLKEAASTVTLLGRCHEPRSSLLRVEPHTGRFHQVRRHVRDLHHPILGDADHGDSRVNRWWREERGLDRLALHALRLELPLPDGSRLAACCPLFEDQRRVYEALPWWEEATAREPALLLPALPLS